MGSVRRVCEVASTTKEGTGVESLDRKIISGFCRSLGDGMENFAEDHESIIIKQMFIFQNEQKKKEMEVACVQFHRCGLQNFEVMCLIPTELHEGWTTSVSIQACWVPMFLFAWRVCQVITAYEFERHVGRSQKRVAFSFLENSSSSEIIQKLAEQQRLQHAGGRRENNHVFTLHSFLEIRSVDEARREKSLLGYFLMTQNQVICCHAVN